jgi:hypothetical protein
MLLRRLPAVLLPLGPLSFGPLFAAAPLEGQQECYKPGDQFIRNGDARGPRLSQVEPYCARTGEVCLPSSFLFLRWHREVIDSVNP